MILAARMTFLAAAASLVLLVVSPSSGARIGGRGGCGGFRGIFGPEKRSRRSHGGRSDCSISTACLSRRRAAPGTAFIWSVIILVALMSKSATYPCLTIFVCCVAHTVISPIRRGGAPRHRYRRPDMHRPALIIPVAAFSDSILELLGKDPTLTGRTEIWAYVISDIQMKPLLGWGYGSFFGAIIRQPEEISDAVHWVVPQAHNGLLEMLLEIGLVGLTLYVALLVRIMGLGRALPAVFPPGGALGALHASGVSNGSSLIGVSETVLLAPLAAWTGCVDGYRISL